MNKWIGLLDLSASCNDTKPTVFIGAYEHHSNELPWRELSSVDLKIVPLCQTTAQDVSWLRTQLESIEPGRRIIGSLSATSNVTGIRTDVEEINRLVKDHGGVTGWDFAAAGPTVKMGMTLGGGIDALFSFRTVVGGPGTPGVLIVNEASLSPTKPTVHEESICSRPANRCLEVSRFKFINHLGDRYVRRSRSRAWRTK